LGLRTQIKFGIASALIALVASRLGAQTVRPYQPAIDVLDYDLNLDLPDTGSVIRGTATLTARRTASTDSLLLDLVGLDVGRVTVDGQSVRFGRTAERIAVPLPKGKAGTFRIAVQYSGAPTDGLIVRTDSAGRWTGFGDNWPNRARFWIPSVDHPSDKATVTWTVRGPAARTVVANGKLVSTRPVRGSDRVETVWRETQPIPVYLMVIAAAPLAVYELGDTSCGLAELQRCVPQFVYTAPEQRAMLPGAFARAAGIVQLFSQLVGKFPYEKLAHLQSSTRFGGMENASAIFYSDNSFRRGTMNDGLIAHETAHQWFGDAVTERDWPHVWLSEGFATYFAALWTRAARGDSAFRADMARIRRTVLADTTAVSKRPVIDTIETNLLRLLNRNSYEKGGFVLHMLRAQVGERAFFEGLRAYYTKYRNATAVTDDLRAEVERASGQSLGWFFDQWLRRPGFPEITATWSYDSTAHEAVIRVAQKSRFGLYRFPLTIAVIDSTGEAKRTKVDLSPSNPTAEVRVSIAAAPKSIALDPDTDLLAALSVNHP